MVTKIHKVMDAQIKCHWRLIKPQPGKVITFHLPAKGRSLHNATITDAHSLAQLNQTQPSLNLLTAAV